MSAFIDAGIFVAAYNTRDDNHSRAIDLVNNAIKGQYGSLSTSDYIFDEAVTLMLARTKNPEFAFGVGEFILGNPSRSISSFAKFIRVNEEVFSNAWIIFKRYAVKGLSFTDCTTVALMKREKIDALLSFDRGFDGIVKRWG